MIQKKFICPCQAKDLCTFKQCKKSNVSVLVDVPQFSNLIQGKTTDDNINYKFAKQILGMVARNVQNGFRDLRSFSEFNGQVSF